MSSGEMYLLKVFHIFARMPYYLALSGYANFYANTEDLSDFCSNPTCGGGGELYTGGVFFVQIIFADRYIHRREM